MQTAAFVAVASVHDYLDDLFVKNVVLPKLKAAFENSSTDQRILMNALSCFLERLEKSQIIDDVLPILWAVKLNEPEIINRVVSEYRPMQDLSNELNPKRMHSSIGLFSLSDIYRLMLTQKKYGLSINIMATRVMPSLLPQTVNPGLNLDQFGALLDLLQDMLNFIERSIFKIFIPTFVDSEYEFLNFDMKQNSK